MIDRPPLRITPGYTLREITDHAIKTALRRNGYSYRRAARELNISFKTVYNRMRGDK